MEGRAAARGSNWCSLGPSAFGFSRLTSRNRLLGHGQQELRGSNGRIGAVLSCFLSLRCWAWSLGPRPG